MTNLEIDRKLAKAMGYDTRTAHGICMVNCDPPDPNFYPWSPTGNIRHAWDIVEQFGVQQLNIHDGGWRVWAGIDKKWVSADAETAPLAICKAALKVIENQEGSKSSESEN